MKSKLPPLAWFRAFESAARHLNMTVAAQELGLTQPAVSQQIQLLEHRINMTLFERRPTGLALTDSGRRLLPQVSESIDGLTRLIAEFDTQQETNRLNIAASESFARGYITPILPGFLVLHPSLRVRIKTTLWHDRVVAVCAPDFFAQPPNWATICAAPRIQTVVITETWERWAAALNLSQPQGELHLVDAHGLGIDFALSGTGVVLTSLLIAAPYLLSQELIMPHEGYVDANERYFLATNPTTDNLFAKPLAEQIRQHSKKMMQTAADKFLR